MIKDGGVISIRCDDCNREWDNFDSGLGRGASWLLKLLLDASQCGWIFQWNHRRCGSCVCPECWAGRQIEAEVKDRQQQRAK